MSNLPTETPKTILIAGASRGLGQAMAAAFVSKGWHVIGTVRDGGRTDLHALADAWPDQITIEPLDITEPAQIRALRERMPSGALDILFVNAGTANRDAAAPAARVATEDFMQVMLTNALGVMRAVEGLEDLVKSDGL
ncbi:short-chain dehydrogenase/reductase SDR (plasmid) [Tistrella mobilis KA081020-065]|uniref:Short-chain dehydrogenase/reductase SDR n=1 Tax=Tistrella mobilis (strain KA081020-065) TaxID=1110502 RepID=I3TT45_TISMK|nr:short-chain dehydrogenase/reductase SDR [Tistrella mobilis KA081020-065]